MRLTRSFLILEVPTFGLIPLDARIMDVKTINNMTELRVPPTII
jgi:hypothetical protein